MHRKNCHLCHLQKQKGLYTVNMNKCTPATNASTAIYKHRTHSQQGTPGALHRSSTAPARDGRAAAMRKRHRKPGGEPKAAGRRAQARRCPRLAATPSARCGRRPGPARAARGARRRRPSHGGRAGGRGEARQEVSSGSWVKVLAGASALCRERPRAP